MYNIPDKYKKESIINKENFVPIEETSNNKKKIRQSLKRVKLKHQIDKDIPNLVNDAYNIQVIMILEVELKSMNHIEYLNEVFQSLLKGYAIIKYIHNDNTVWGYGYKRLNKQDKNSIILEKSYVTGEIKENFFFDNFLLYEKYLNFKNIKNKNDKLGFYIENMTKAFIISNKDMLQDYIKILDSNIFYSLDSTFKLYNILEKTIDIKNKLKNKTVTSEKIDLNKNLVNLIKELEAILDERY